VTISSLASDLFKIGIDGKPKNIEFFTKKFDRYFCQENSLAILAFYNGLSILFVNVITD